MSSFNHRPLVRQRHFTCPNRRRGLDLLTLIPSSAQESIETPDERVWRPLFAAPGQALQVEDDGIVSDQASLTETTKSQRDGITTRDR
jgi:hypothetical protein